MTRLMQYAAAMLLIYGVTAQAASFDCAKAKGETEKMICGDAELSSLDDALAVAYKKAIANPADKAFVRQWQRTWLSMRSACGALDCMKPAYTAQISDLNERAERSAPGGYSGKYERVYRGKPDKHTSNLTIVELKNDRVRVFGVSVWVGNSATGNVNVGEVNGLARLAGNKISYQEPENEECKFIITLDDKGLKVGDDKLNCGGHNVTFSGDYRRIGALK